MLQLLREEGERVSEGGTVAAVFADQASLDLQTELASLENRIEQLQYALDDRTQTGDASRLDSQVLASITALRSLTAQGDLTTLEDCALNLRTMVFKRDFAYGDGSAAGQLSQHIQSKQEQLAQLKPAQRPEEGGVEG